MTAVGYEILGEDNENVPKLIVVMDAQVCEYTKNTELYTLKW